LKTEPAANKKSNQLRFQAPIIYLITNGETNAHNFAANKNSILRLVKIAVDAKISLIQIREKQLPALKIFELVSECVKITQTSETKLLVNDRADIALAAGADGVHLTLTSISCVIIRRKFPENFIIGVSAHNFKEASEAKSQNADFITFSPIFGTPEKGEPKGLDELSKVCKKLDPFPVIALGGIDETNYASVLDNGARGFAAIRFLTKAENLRNLAADKKDKYR
jgi:thiamine-phosphate pyrophosphorylase